MSSKVLDVKSGYSPTEERLIPDSTPKPIYRIMDLHEADRRRERLASLGPQALTNAESIAILVRVGVRDENAIAVGQRPLSKFGGLTGLHRAPFAELKKQHAIGDAKAAEIKAAIEIGRRLILESPEERPAINSLLTPRWFRKRCTRWSRSTCGSCCWTSAITYRKSWRFTRDQCAAWRLE